MKKFHYLALFLFSVSLSCFCQTSERGNGFIFPDFTDGYVLQKDGSRIKSRFNYSTIGQEMLFKNSDNTILSLANLDQVVLVNIDGRTFEHAGGKTFYERIEAGKGRFYVYTKSNILSQGKAAGYGGYSKTSAADNLEYLGNAPTAQITHFSPNEKYELTTNRIYYLKVSNKFKKINSIKVFLEANKEHKSEIEAFASEMKINLKDPEDIKKLTAYCAELSK